MTYFSVVSIVASLIGVVAVISTVVTEKPYGLFVAMACGLVVMVSNVFGYLNKID